MPVVSIVLHSRAFSKRETEACRRSNAQMDSLMHSLLTHVPKKSPPFLSIVLCLCLDCSIFQKTIPSFSLNILLDVQGSVPWGNLPDLPGYNELLSPSGSHRGKVQTPVTCFYHLSTIALGSLHIWLSMKPRKTPSSDASLSGFVCPCSPGHNPKGRLSECSPVSQT